MTDPGEIGLALFNPGRVGVAVVSILQLLGIGIYRADGTVVMRGNERAPGDPWLSESEVHGLIDMGVQDLLDHPDGNTPYTVADLYAPLADSLPGVTKSQFIAAYRDSYERHADDFAPTAMLGQPMDEEAHLTRTQLWLLYLDGFVDLAPSTTGRLASGTQMAAASPHFGTANAVLPQLLQPQGMSAADWVELRPHLPTIAWTIPFEVDIGSVHEGHGGEGQPDTITATIQPGQPFRSAIDNRILLQPNPGSLGGVNVEWGTRAYPVLDRHGRLDQALPATSQTDAGGAVRLTYTPKKEKADGHGFVATEFGSVLARANLADLIKGAYLVDNTAFAHMLALGTLGGTRTEAGGFQIDWHTAGLFVSVRNTYHATFDLSGAVGPVVARASRDGAEDAQGVLFKLDDGSYYGEMFANVNIDHSHYEYVGVLGGRGLCEDTSPIAVTQDLLVSAASHPTANPAYQDAQFWTRILDNADGTRGEMGDEALLLRFFPSAPPSSTNFGCEQAIPFDQQYAGLVPGGMLITADYAPFNDSRWSNPQIGYPIFLPKEHTLTYQDVSLRTKNSGIRDVDATWDIVVQLDPP